MLTLLLQIFITTGLFYFLYFLGVYFFNYKLYTKHFAVLNLFFNKPVEKSFGGIIKFLGKLNLYLTIFLPSKILLHNGIYEKNLIMWAFYTIVLSYVFLFFLISENIYFTSLSLLYLTLHVQIILLSLLIKNSFFKLNLIFFLGLSHEEFDEITFFCLGNISLKTVLSSVCIFGTAGGITLVEMSREYSIASSESLEIYHTGVKAAEAAIQAHDFRLEQIEAAIKKQIEVDKVKNFEYFHSKGFSLESALSKAECIAEKDYACVQESYSALSQGKSGIVDSLIDLEKRRRVDFDKALSKQPLYYLIPQLKDFFKK